MGKKKFNEYYFLHKLHLHELPSQLFNRFLKAKSIFIFNSWTVFSGTYHELSFPLPFSWQHLGNDNFFKQKKYERRALQ